MRTNFVSGQVCPVFLRRAIDSSAILRAVDLVTQPQDRLEVVRERADREALGERQEADQHYPVHVCRTFGKHGPGLSSRRAIGQLAANSLDPRKALSPRTASPSGPKRGTRYAKRRLGVLGFLEQEVLDRSIGRAETREAVDDPLDPDALVPEVGEVRSAEVVVPTRPHRRVPGSVQPCVAVVQRDDLPPIVEHG